MKKGVAITARAISYATVCVLLCDIIDYKGKILWTKGLL